MAQLGFTDVDVTGTADLNLDAGQALGRDKDLLAGIEVPFADAITGIATALGVRASDIILKQQNIVGEEGHWSAR